MRIACALLGGVLVQGAACSAGVEASAPSAGLSGGAPAANAGASGLGVTGGAASTGLGGSTAGRGGALGAVGGTSVESGGASAVSGGRSAAIGGVLNSAGGVLASSGGVSSGGSATAGAPAPTGGRAAITGGSGGMGDSGAGSSAKASEGPAETTPQGYGQGTTGGGNKASQKASTLAQMQALIDEYAGSGGLVIEYTGSFDFKSISDACVQHTLEPQVLEIKRKNDITVIGADGSAANFGIHIASTASNIIVRNMTIGLTPGADGSDIVSIEGMSDGFPSKIWIDHNEFFTSMIECDGAGDTEFDGMVDLKKGADEVTVSYNYFHDHHKVSLNGASDSDTDVRRITFHHNLFENVGARVPLQRGGLSHLLNNYFLDVLVSGINVRMNGNSLIEGNYFENVKNPVTSRDSDEIGFWDLRNNNLAGPTDVAAGNPFGITWDDGNDGTVNATDWKTSEVFPAQLGYDYAAQSFECVRAGLRAVVGAGKGLKTLTCD